MTKTDQMLLIEARTGRDVREVLAEAYSQAGGLVRASRLVQERTGVPMNAGKFSEWIDLLGGFYAKSLVFSPSDIVSAEAEAVAA
jgi:hypothetical protein